MVGQPTHIELGVPDANRARTFYGQLLGWTPTGEIGPGSVETASLPIGLHSADPQAEMLVFLAVDDLDSALNQLTRLGGTALSDVVQDAGFGRYAVCVDDQGVRFALHQRP